MCSTPKQRKTTSLQGNAVNFKQNVLANMAPLKGELSAQAD